MEYEKIVLGPRQTFLTGLFTVENLYRRTHTVSCFASIGSGTNPSFPKVTAKASRAFVLRVKVLETSSDGSEGRYDLTGMSLKVVLKRYYRYHESRPADIVKSAEIELPEKMGLFYVSFDSEDLEEPGDYTVEVVDDRGEGVFSSICEFDLKLTSP